MCSYSHWQAYIGLLTHRISAISHDENVLFHRHDRCLLHGRKNVIWNRRLHHCGTKAIGKGGSYVWLVIQRMLLNGLWYGRAI